jgi:hypothetical protein
MTMKKVEVKLEPEHEKALNYIIKNSKNVDIEKLLLEYCKEIFKFSEEKDQVNYSGVLNFDLDKDLYDKCRKHGEKIGLPFDDFIRLQLLYKSSEIKQLKDKKKENKKAL